MNTTLLKRFAMAALVSVLWIIAGWTAIAIIGYTGYWAWQWAIHLGTGEVLAVFIAILAGATPPYFVVFLYMILSN